MSLVVEATHASSVNPHPPHRACRPRSVSSAQRSALQLHRGAARFDLLKTVPSRGGWAGHLHVLHTDDGCWTLSSGPTPTVECASECACTLKGMHPFVLGIWVIWGGPPGLQALTSLPSDQIFPTPRAETRTEAFLATAMVEFPTASSVWDAKCIFKIKLSIEPGARRTPRRARLPCAPHHVGRHLQRDAPRLSRPGRSHRLRLSLYRHFFAWHRGCALPACPHEHRT